MPNHDANHLTNFLLYILDHWGDQLHAIAPLIAPTVTALVVSAVWLTVMTVRSDRSAA